jgi:hypothetical protein
MATKTKIICVVCGEETEKPAAEIKRQKKRGKTEFYCSLKCAGKNKNNLKHLKKFKDNFLYTRYIRQKDKHSGFRWYMKNIKRNSKKRNHTYDVDIEYLEMIWKEQDGICPFTKEKLQLKTHSDDRFSTPYSASIDRIDNSKGYIKGNIRFVALMFNYARNKFSDEQVIDFCKQVASNA